jgi:uncharacterized membrane protein YeaQ/YmgE (transglycosylase-associated protein family)
MASLLGILIVGAIAGWLAGIIMKGSGYGIGINIVIGIVGAIIGGVLFAILGFSAHGFIGSTIVATIGSVVLLFVLNKLKSA